MVPCLPKLKIDLPDQIAGLNFEQRVDLEDPANGGQPGAGVRLVYVKDIKQCDIHEYDFGRKDIGTGIADPVFEQEFQRSLSENARSSLEIIPAGQPEQITVSGNSPVIWQCAGGWLSKPDNPAYRQQERWFESYVCLTSWKGIFIKIKLSHYLGQAVGSVIRANAEELDKVRPAFLKELMLPFVTTVSDLLTGTQTRESIQQHLDAEQQKRDAQWAEEKRRSDQMLKEQIEAGERCPNCGLQLTWNGWACEQCQFHLPDS